MESKAPVSTRPTVPSDKTKGSAEPCVSNVHEKFNRDFETPITETSNRISCGPVRKSRNRFDEACHSRSWSKTASAEESMFLALVLDDGLEAALAVFRGANWVIPALSDRLRSI